MMVKILPTVLIAIDVGAGVVYACAGCRRQAQGLTGAKT